MLVFTFQTNVVNGHVCTTLSYCICANGVLLYQINNVRSFITASAVVPQSNQLNFIKSAGGDSEISRRCVMLRSYLACGRYQIRAENSL